MDILKEMGVDKKKAVDGIWVKLDNDEGDVEVEESDIGPDDAAIKIARADNVKYQRAISKKIQPLIMKRGRKALDPMVRQKAEAESLYETVILDWRNLQYDGKPFPFSLENVIKLWIDVEFSAFKDRIVMLINDEEMFRAEIEEEAVKN